jgi:hypothetical protein
MPPTAEIVHQTRERLRLRIAARRRDLPFFLRLYEQLRIAPGVEEVTMNPLTGSVLLRFDARRRNTLLGALADSPLISLQSRTRLNPAVEGRAGTAGGIIRFLESRGASATDPRFIVFLIMLGIAVRQLIKGQLLAPAVSLALYGLELLVLLRRR